MGRGHLGTWSDANSASGTIVRAPGEAASGRGHRGRSARSIPRAQIDPSKSISSQYPRSTTLDAVEARLARTVTRPDACPASAELRRRPARPRPRRRDARIEPLVRSAAGPVVTPGGDANPRLSTTSVAWTPVATRAEPTPGRPPASRADAGPDAGQARRSRRAGGERGRAGGEHQCRRSRQTVTTVTTTVEPVTQAVEPVTKVVEPVTKTVDTVTGALPKPVGGLLPRLGG